MTFIKTALISNKHIQWLNSLLIKNKYLFSFIKLYKRNVLAYKPFWTKNLKKG